MRVTTTCGARGLFLLAVRRFFATLVRLQRFVPRLDAEPGEIQKNLVQELERLAVMHSRGQLTWSEFGNARAELLG